MKELSPLPPQLRVVEEEGLWVIYEQGGDSIAVAHKARLGMYRSGIERRLQALARQYCLPNDYFLIPRVVVDVGAHSGEIGVLTTRSGGKYFAFEPDPNAFEALSRNVPGGSLHAVALADTDRDGEFFVKTDSADSSLYPLSEETAAVVPVRVHALDTLAAQIGLPDEIDLLKVEAEGMEPEVLVGATETLRRCRLLAVDVSPERGGESTAPSVSNIVHPAGFRLANINLSRGTMLFENLRLSHN